jgi:IS605 OrfB family transposase
MAEGEQDNADLWRKVRYRDDSFAHLVSRRIVDFAQEQGVTILVFEHLGKLRPEKGKYSKRGNSKRAYWMKGRIFVYSKYKAWEEGILTSRINPRNTSRECARCGGLVVRYAEGQPAEGYTSGAPLATEREEKSSGVVVCQEAKSEEGPSIAPARHADDNGHGSAPRGEYAWMDASSQLFLLHYDEQ